MNDLHMSSQEVVNEDDSKAVQGKKTGNVFESISRTAGALTKNKNKGLCGATRKRYKYLKKEQTQAGRGQ